MGGGHRHRVGALGREGVHAHAVLVDRHRHGVEPGRLELPAARRAPGVLHGDPAPAAGDERAPEERHPLGHARGHDHALGVGRHAAYAAEVGGKRATQLGRAARIAVVEPRVGRVAERAPDRGEPGRAREERHVGPAGPEVEARRSRIGQPRLRSGRAGGHRRHARLPALAGHEVALRRELGVGLDDHAAREPELAGKAPARGQGGARREPALAHAGAQLLLDLDPQRGLRAVERDEQVALAHNWSIRRARNWSFHPNQ